MKMLIWLLMLDTRHLYIRDKISQCECYVIYYPSPGMFTSYHVTRGIPPGACRAR